MAHTPPPTTPDPPGIWPVTFHNDPPPTEHDLDNLSSLLEQLGEHYGPEMVADAARTLAGEPEPFALAERAMLLRVAELAAEATPEELVGLGAALASVAKAGYG